MAFETKDKLQLAWQKILQTLGLTDKAKENKMTDEDWASFGTAFEKEFGVTVQAASQEIENTSSTSMTLTDDMKEEIQGSIAKAFEGVGIETPTIDLSSFGTAMAGLMGAVGTLTDTVAILSSKQEDSKPVSVIGASLDASMYARVLGHAPHSTTHLFGVDEGYFKRGTWWNEIVATGKGKDQYRDEDATQFRGAFNNFSKDFATRCGELVDSNQVGLLDYDKMVKGESYIDYSQMTSKLGEFTVRRFDLIIAYFRSLSSVGLIFPVVPGVQNEETAPTALFGELSQSFLSGHNYKGDIQFDGEKYHVDDCMMKFAFMSPKDLEKAFIGWQNREGSNPMKWHFFEWCIVYFGKNLFNEQQRRRVVGVCTPRQGDYPQPAMLAADGVLRAIQRVEEENKVLPFKDLKIYDETTILDYIRSFWAKVSDILPNMEGLKVYANQKHQLWYVDAYNEKYGKNTDFTGVKDDIRYYSPQDIVWVPNMDKNDYKMWITVPGNVENYELKPHEMLAFYFQQDLEILIIASWWKEGAGVLAPGVPFATETDLEESERIHQFLFTNYPVTELAPNATKLDGKLNREYLTGVNTAATEITDIEKPSIEKVYKIICGDVAFPSTIKQAGKFKINSDYTPKAVGDYIKVYAETEEKTKLVNKKTIKYVAATGNFLELERKVSN